MEFITMRNYSVWVGHDGDTFGFTPIPEVGEPAPRYPDRLPISSQLRRVLWESAHSDDPFPYTMTGRLVPPPHPRRLPELAPPDATDAPVTIANGHKRPSQPAKRPTKLPRASGTVVRVKKGAKAAKLLTAAILSRKSPQAAPLMGVKRKRKASKRILLGN